MGSTVTTASAATAAACGPTMGGAAAAATSPPRRFLGAAVVLAEAVTRRTPQEGGVLGSVDGSGGFCYPTTTTTATTTTTPTTEVLTVGNSSKPVPVSVAQRRLLFENNSNSPPPARNKTSSVRSSFNPARNGSNLDPAKTSSGTSSVLTIPTQNIIVPANGDAPSETPTVLKRNSFKEPSPVLKRNSFKLVSPGTPARNSCDAVEPSPVLKGNSFQVVSPGTPARKSSHAVSAETKSGDASSKTSRNKTDTNIKVEEGRAIYEGDSAIRGGLANFTTPTPKGKDECVDVDKLSDCDVSYKADVLKTCSALHRVLRGGMFDAIPIACDKISGNDIAAASLAEAYKDIAPDAKDPLTGISSEPSAEPNRYHALAVSVKEADQWHRHAVAYDLLQPILAAVTTYYRDLRRRESKRKDVRNKLTETLLGLVPPMAEDLNVIRHKLVTTEWKARVETGRQIVDDAITDFVTFMDGDSRPAELTLTSVLGDRHPTLLEIKKDLRGMKGTCPFEHLRETLCRRGFAGGNSRDNCYDNSLSKLWSEAAAVFMTKYKESNAKASDRAVYLRNLDKFILPGVVADKTVKACYRLLGGMLREERPQPLWAAEDRKVEDVNVNEVMDRWGKGRQRQRGTFDEGVVRYRAADDQ